MNIKPNENLANLPHFVKQRRKQVGLTQTAFADKAGVALTVIRKIEQGKTDLQLEKVNQVLRMFGHELAPVDSRQILKQQHEKS